MKTFNTICSTLFLIFLFCLLVNVAYSTSYTWKGATNHNWNTTTNWTPNGTPGSGDNVTLNSTGNSPTLQNNVTVTNFTISSGTFDCNGDTITVNGSSNFNGGTITNGMLLLRGITNTFAGTLIDIPVDAVVSTLVFNGSTFNRKVIAEADSTYPGISNGGSIFNDTVWIYKSNTGTGTFRLANTTGNTYNSLVTFKNAGTAIFETTTNGGSKYNGNVIVESTGAGGINFGATSGSDTLASGKNISIGGAGFTGTLLMRNFIQLGSTSQSLTLSGANINLISCTFNGAVTFSGTSVLLKQNVFNGTASITHSGNTSASSDGGNTFNAAANFYNTGTSNSFRLGLTYNDTFNDNVTCTASSGGEVRFAYNDSTTVFKNVTFSGAVNSGYSGTGVLRFAGSNAQTFTVSSHNVYHILMDKTAGNVTMSGAMSILGSLNFIKGNIITTSSNLITMNSGSTTSGGNSNSFVSGPIKKVGSAAIIFPTGKNNSYRPIEISAPSVSNDAFTAEYFDSNQSSGYSRDTSIHYLNSCQHWQLARNNGSATVTVKLSYDSTSCGIVDSATLRVASWNGTKWKDLGNGGITGNRYVGKIVNSTAVATYGYFTLANNLCFLTANAGTDKSLCAGDSTTIGASPVASFGTGPIGYTWSPSTALSSTTATNPKASPSSNTNYVVTLIDSGGCTKTDTLTVNYHALPTASAGVDTTFCLGDSVAIGGSPTASGGGSPYTYSWNPSTGLSSASVANPKANPASTTNYIVTVTDVYGCTKKDTMAMNNNTIVYTWTGVTSNYWNTSTNWSPNGTPGECDIVYIDKHVYLNNDVTVRGLTSTGTDLKLFGHTLGVGGKTVFNSSIVTGGGGNLAIYTEDSVVFNSTYFGTDMYAGGGKIFFNGSTFTTYNEFYQLGNDDVYSNGGNVFNGGFSMENMGNGNIYFATAAADTFKADVYIQNYENGNFYPAYTKNSVFKGDVILLGTNRKLTFGANGGRSIFNGTTQQEITVYGSSDTLVNFSKLQINKPSGDVKLDFPIRVTDSLFLTKGNINSDTTNLIIMNAGSVVTGAADTSFVNGPLLKYGNSAFIFPIGKENRYAAIGISAPSNLSDAFTGEYFNTRQPLGNSMDSTLNYINDCNFWKINQKAGSSNINVKFSFDSLACYALPQETPHITYWNGSKWIDKEEGVNEGSFKKINTSVNSFGYFTFSYFLSKPNFSFLKNYGLFANDETSLVDSISVSGYAASRSCDNYALINASEGVQSDTEIINKIHTSLMDVIAVCNSLNGDTIISSDIDGDTLMSGIYYIENDLELYSSLTLVGDTSSIFIINVMGDLKIENNVNINILGAVKRNVYFNVIGDINIYDSTSINGIYISSGNINVYGKVSGRKSLLSLNDINLPYELSLNGSAFMFSPGLNHFQTFEGCGINYVQVTQNLHQRTRNSPLPAGSTQPVNLALPPFSGDIVAAYLFFTCATVNTPYFGIFPTLNGNPLYGQLITYSPSNSTCWSATHTGEIDYQNTAVYAATISPSIILGNGLDVLNFLPVEPANQLNANYDTDGATLLVVYSDECSNKYGYLSMDYGIKIVTNGAIDETLSTFSPRVGAVNSSNAFMLAGDYENSFAASSVLNINGTNIPVTADFFNYLETSPVDVSANINYHMGWNSPDCSNLSLIGAYYNYTNSSCDPFTLDMSSTPITCTGINDGTAEVAISGGVSPYSTVWSTSTTTTSISGLSAGTYTVTVTDDNGCTNSAQVVVGNLNQGPAAPVISGDNFACTDNPEYTITSASGVTYSWITSWSESGSGTTASVTIPTGGGTITFTATQGSCSTPTTLTIYPCCDVPEDADDLSNLTSSYIADNYSSFQHAGVTLGGELYFQCNYFHSGDYFNIYLKPDLTAEADVVINGTLHIDQRTTFLHTRLILGPNAKIIIDPDAYLGIENSYVSACDGYMWKHIYASNSTCTLYVAASVIEDGQNAVLLSNDAQYLIGRSTFNKNWRSIELKDYTLSPSLEMKQLLFTCIEDNVPNNACLPPHLNERSYSGIELTNTPNVLIGENAGLLGSVKNLFYNLDIGIKAIESSLTVVNSDFDLITNSSPCNAPCPSLKGYAVYSDAGTSSPHSLTFGGTGTYEPNTVKNSTRGIMLQNFMDADIIKNTFSNMEVAAGSNAYDCIFGRYLKSNTVNIENNIFNGFDRGIHFTQLAGNCDMVIKNNKFNYTGYTIGHVGIRLENPLNAHATVNNVNVETNKIYRVNRKGISLVNFPNSATIASNDIKFYFPSAPSSPVYGIQAASSSKTIVDGNIVQKDGSDPGSSYDGKLFGISIETSEKTLVTNNLLLKNGTGVRYFNDHVLNTITCNAITRNRRGVLINNSNIGDQGSSSNSQDNQWYSASSPSWNIQGTGTSVASVKWWAQSSSLPWTSPINFLNPSSVYPFPYAPTTNSCDVACIICRQEQIAKIIKEQDYYSSLTAEELYNAKKAAYYELKGDSALMYQGNSNDTLLMNYFDSVKVASIGLLAEVDELMKDSVVQGAALNSTVSADNYAEENEKTVNEIYAATWGDGVFEFTEEQYNTLYTIAVESPVSGGTSVYNARVLLDMDVDDGMEAESRLDFQPVQETKLGSDKKGILYPNPAKQLCYYKIHLEEKGKVEMYDVYGKKLRTFDLKIGNNLIEINTSSLAAGIYLLKTSAGNVSEIFKLFIEK